jgi:hypothetical protein
VIEITSHLAAGKSCRKQQRRRRRKAASNVESAEASVGLHRLRVWCGTMQRPYGVKLLCLLRWRCRRDSLAISGGVAYHPLRAITRGRRRKIGNIAPHVDATRRLALFVGKGPPPNSRISVGR